MAVTAFPPAERHCPTSVRATRVPPRRFMATFRNGLLATATLLVGVLLPIAASAQLEATAERAETDDHLSKEYSVCIDKAVEGAWSDMFACNGEELDRQDARLNNAYKKLMSKLTRLRKKEFVKQ